jgi:hypothetical protein
MSDNIVKLPGVDKSEDEDELRAATRQAFALRAEIAYRVARNDLDRKGHAVPRLKIGVAEKRFMSNRPVRGALH